MNIMYVSVVNTIIYSYSMIILTIADIIHSMDQCMDSVIP